VSLAAFIVSQRDEHAVPAALACRALGVSQAWFYKWRHGDVSPRRARRTALDAAVAWLFRRRGGRDGSPPITAALHDLGWKVSKNTVAASMRERVKFFVEVQANCIRFVTLTGSGVDHCA
jgi:putative transposase